MYVFIYIKDGEEDTNMGFDLFFAGRQGCGQHGTLWPS